MSVQRLHYLLICLMLLLLTHACKDDEFTGPSNANPKLLAFCDVCGSDVCCTAILFDDPAYGSQQDVTQDAAWLSTDESIGDFLQPGHFVPNKSGEVGIWPRYNQYESSVVSWFLVQPSQPAQWLYFFTGMVMDESTGLALPGVEVRILNGYNENDRAITNDHGAYEIDRVLTLQEFQVRASKDGYEPQTKPHHVNPPVGPYSEPIGLNFSLREIR